MHIERKRKENEEKAHDRQLFNSFLFSYFIPLIQLYDKISCTVMSPARAPPGDSIIRCRDVIDVIISAPGHKYNREKNELLQLLSHPHMQVSLLINLIV